MVEKIEKHRAKKLADRILEGAGLLADFAESLSDLEWSMAISATDNRTVGTVVRHVGFMYPIEIEAVLAISKGMPVDVTWEAIAEINGKHAVEFPSPTKTEAIELLRTNSRVAADTVRQLSDEQLDTAAAFGLSYGAPVTAQFVIEDHPLRHAWHHLAKIRKAVGR